MTLTQNKLLERAWAGVTPPSKSANGVAIARTWLSAKHPGFVHYEVISLASHEATFSKRPINPSLVPDALDMLLTPLGHRLADIRWRPDSTKPHDGEKQRAAEVDASNFVYFLAAGPFLKIGKTSGAPDARIRELQTGCPFPIHLVAHTTGGMKRERELHKQFAKYRAHGEWFRHEGDLAVFVQELAGGLS